MDRFNQFLGFDEQIDALKAMGIGFNGRFTERGAKAYLRDNNSFFRLISYCDSFEYDSLGTDGKPHYGNLDFEQLVDLSVIDFRLREVLLHLTIHIEHHLKIMLHNILRLSDSDPYRIVRDFKESPYVTFDLRQELERASRSDYSRDLYTEFQPDIPVWVMLELLQLGYLRSFVGFLRQRDEADTSIPIDFDSLFYELNSARSLRNAAAHNTGIFNGLLNNDDRTLSDRIYNVLIEAEHPDGGFIFTEEELEDSHLSRALKDITTALFLHHEMVTSRGVKKSMAERLDELRHRFSKRVQYEETSAVGSAFSFITRLIDLWYPLS